MHDRRPLHRGGLVHHSDRGSRCVSIKHKARLLESGIEPSVGSVGDNAVAETIKGLYSTELIHRRVSWRSFERVEFATLEWVDWFNNRRLLVVRSLLSIPDSSVNRPTKYRASGARRQFWIAKG